MTSSPGRIDPVKERLLTDNWLEPLPVKVAGQDVIPGQAHCCPVDARRLALRHGSRWFAGGSPARPVCASAPHPDPLPARGEREKAAARGEPCARKHSVDRWHVRHRRSFESRRQKTAAVSPLPVLHGERARVRGSDGTNRALARRSCLEPRPLLRPDSINGPTTSTCFNA